MDSGLLSGRLFGPGGAVGVGEAGEGFGFDLDAVTGGGGDLVVAVADDGGVEEVLVEVIDELDDAVFEGGGDGEEVEDGEVLDVLAEADTAGVGADGDVEFGG
jgi:hypothetical protein